MLPNPEDMGENFNWNVLSFHVLGAPAKATKGCWLTQVWYQCSPSIHCSLLSLNLRT